LYFLASLVISTSPYNAGAVAAAWIIKLGNRASECGTHQEPENAQRTFFHCSKRGANDTAKTRHRRETKVIEFKQNQIEFLAERKKDYLDASARLTAQRPVLINQTGAFFAAHLQIRASADD
jgi:hypothetical protein